MAGTSPDFDVLIVGAGISGIGMAAHMQAMCPDRSFAIVERREGMGGTWDLFRYPGVRSDSDMHTLGFSFEPWRHEKAIADGPAILDYLHRIVEERGIGAHIRFGHRVIAADFDTPRARWQVTVETPDGETRQLSANWLYLGSGYYDYDEAFDPGFDLAAFGGRVVHPQFWPADLDHAGRRVVVIGSGATAVTVVPAMAATAAHVTMLQRTPTWMFSRPAKDAIANFLRRWLPERTAYRLTRWKNIRLQDIGYKRAKTKPLKVKDFLLKRLRRLMGEDYDLAPFTPPYDPWDQRLCLVPDDDLFSAIKAGRASVVTGRIAGFEAAGVRLEGGTLLPADILVTATGLKLAVAGKIAISLDGAPVDFSRHFYYKGCMFSNLPNLAVVFGYLNASWTLRADLNADYVCRVLNAMRGSGADIAVPVLPVDHGLEEDDVFNLSSGYIQRAKAIMPRNAVNHPWRLSQEYIADRRRMRRDPIDDGILALRQAQASAPAPAPMAAPGATLEPAE
ncbi:MAG: NAD(P)/FAD-dependent oxidoreductase [Altererythrobacter sp.]|nr:NAD(P)/FAD-dependent oxidoreductase [Altererythrobacter sp.]